MKKIFTITLFLFLFLASNCFAVTFTLVEVVSDNRLENQTSEWRFSADVMLAPGYSPSYNASFSVVDGPMHTLNYIFWGVDLYDSGAIGVPSEYVGKTCSWKVKDGANEIYATGIIPPSVRQVALSTDVTISDKPTPNHPTVSWKNLDPYLSQYRLRVLLASDPTKVLWQTTFFPPLAQNMTYTICGFSFQPEINYVIRIEARQILSFPVTGTGLGTLSSSILQNRSTVFVNYKYDTPAPSPTGDVYIDSATGLEWLIMNKTVCKSPDSIKDGTDGDNLADQRWVHATNQQITDLLINAGMNPPFTGTSSPGNYDGAKFILDVLGYTYDYTDSMDQESLSIQAFANEGPPSPSGYLYTPVLIVGHMLTGNVGGATIPGPSVPSSVASPTIGNWLVRAHIDDIPPTLAPVPDKTTLWPPNHKTVRVSIVANASDDSGRPVILAATVSSNEPENGLGDGDTAPDWTEPIIDQEDGIITVQLRAERSGRGNGRVYTVTITATDESGNTSIANVDITVAHSQPSVSCTPPPPGLTGWWPGDGTPADIIGIREALLRGDATTGPGLVDQAFILDGNGDFVEVPHGEALNVGTRDFTVDLWVFFNDTVGEQVLVEKWIQGVEVPSQGWTLTKLDDNVLLLAMADVSGEGADVSTSEPLTILAGTWNHFAVTRRDGQVTLFLNGEPVAQGESSLNLNSSSSLKFGHRGNMNDTEGSDSDQEFYLNGRIDEVELFVGRALPPAQIRSIFNAGSAGKCKNLPAHRCFPPPAGLTGWWPGDGNTDDIIGGRSAVLLGDATTGPGLVDGAFVLDGDGGFVEVPHDPALNFGTGDFTVALWAFFNDTAGEQVLAEKWIQGFEVPSQGWTLTKLEDNVLLLAMGDVSGEGAYVSTSDPLPIPAGTWNHFAATRHAGQLTTFMNGVPVASAKGPSVNADSASSLKFGHRGNKYDTAGSDGDQEFYLNGRIDEVQIFVGRALPPAQITAIFKAGRAGMCKELPR